MQDACVMWSRKLKIKGVSDWFVYVYFLHWNYEINCISKKSKVWCYTADWLNVSVYMELARWVWVDRISMKHTHTHTHTSTHARALCKFFRSQRVLSWPWPWFAGSSELFPVSVSYIAEIPPPLPAASPFSPILLQRQGLKSSAAEKFKSYKGSLFKVAAAGAWA